MNNLQISNKYFITASVFYAVAFVLAYAIIPYFTVYNLFPVYVEELARLTLVSSFFVLVGINIPFGKPIKINKLVIPFDHLIFSVFGLFIFVVFIIIITAPNIPIIQSLKGASEEQLNIDREDFLKSRTGWESYLVYIIETINGIIPYLITLSFVKKHKYRYIFAIIFFLYCISFLAKAYFFKIAIPLFVIFFYQAKNKWFFVVKGVVVMIGLIMLMYLFSGAKGFDSDRDDQFFSILYLPKSSYETMIWRSFVVPIITAIDSIRIFMADFGSSYFMGDTSSFIAFAKGAERINFERSVYQGQFGGSETGNSNTYFLIEAFVNFGIYGVALFSFFAGRIIRLFILSKDLALIAILPLFILTLYSAGLISMLLSSGWLLLILLNKFIRISN